MISKIRDNFNSKFKQKYYENLLKHVEDTFAEPSAFRISETPVFIDKKYYNTIMVVAGDSGQIITCYRNGNPHKYIKKKSKRFSRSQSQKAA